MSRRRYDTQALVGDIRRERRHAILLSILGIAILGFLVYYFAKIREPGVPEVPEVVASTAATTPPASAQAPKPQPAPAPPAATPAPALVDIELPRPGPLYIDGELVAKKTKGHQAKLAPGKHKVATKIGRRSVQLTVDAAAGKRYRVDLDPRKKKGAVEEVRP